MQTIQSRLSAVQVNVDRVREELPAIHDAAHRVETALEILPGVAEDVSVLPDMDIKVTALCEELIPAVRALQVIPDISTSLSWD